MFVLVFSTNTIDAYNYSPSSLRRLTVNKRSPSPRNCFVLGKNSNCLLQSTTSTIDIDEEENFDLKDLHRRLDREFFGVAVPAFFALAADPMASIGIV